MNTLILMALLFALTACSTWSKDRVQNSDGKNNLIISNDTNCKPLQDSYTKFINELVSLDAKIASKAALCSVNGPRNEVMREMSTNIRALKEANKTIIQSIKEDKDFSSFDSCFQTLSASGFAFQKYGHTAYSYAAFIANCTSEGKEAFRNAKDPSEFSTKLEELVSDLKF